MYLRIILQLSVTGSPALTVILTVPPPSKRDNVRVISAARDVEIVGADIIAKLSAETSRGRPVAAWDQRIVIRRTLSEHGILNDYVAL